MRPSNTYSLPLPNSRRRRMLTLLGVCISASMLSQAQDTTLHGAPATAQQVKNPYAGQGSAAVVGKAVYKHRCARCHGDAGEGSGNIPPLASGAAQTAPDGAIYWYITRGDADNGMPAWASLPKALRWQVVTYLKSMSGTSPGGATKTSG